MNDEPKWIVHFVSNLWIYFHVYINYWLYSSVMIVSWPATLSTLFTHQFQSLNKNKRIIKICWIFKRISDRCIACNALNSRYDRFQAISIAIKTSRNKISSIKKKHEVFDVLSKPQILRILVDYFLFQSNTSITATQKSILFQSFPRKFCSFCFTIQNSWVSRQISDRYHHRSV